MLAVLRRLSPRLVLIMALPAALAQPPSLPPIFEPRSMPVVATDSSRSTSTFLSDRVRGLISNRVLAESDVFSAPFVPASVDSVARPTNGEAVVMERFVVKSSSLRLIELPPVDTPFLRWIKTGILYRHVGRKMETNISLNFLPVQSAGYGSNQSSTRAELRFSFRW